MQPRLYIMYVDSHIPSQAQHTCSYTHRYAYTYRGGAGEDIKSHSHLLTQARAHTDTHTDTPMHIPAHTHTHTHTHRQTNQPTDRQTDRQTDRNADRQTNRKAGRQAGR